MKTILFLLFFTTPSFAKPLVVATFSILGDMVHEIGQDKIDVKTLVGPDQDSHVFEPRPQHAKELGRADLVVVNGLGFEGWLGRLIEASGFQGKILVATTGIDPLTCSCHNPLTCSCHGEGDPDPHAWHSLKNAQIYTDNIVNGLCALLPQDAPFFKARGEVYKQSLRALENETRQHLAHLPLEKRKVITGHKAFGYLGRDFHIVFYAPLGISTDSEPSAKGVAALIHQIRTEGIQAIFIENISNPRLMEQIASETHTHIGGVLYSDALSAPGTTADTYLKMMRFNLSSLLKAMEKNKG
ncbi:MAG: zinc ABC transporter substrate-binding protein [Alphaproteobacteria bacterium]|nr:zinc ABC transporter substrate-binding protein [Alphaproteobacteria bacterium]